MPVNVLYDTNVAGVILVLRKNRKDSGVLFVDIPGHKEGRKRNELRQGDLNRLIEIYKEFREQGRTVPGDDSGMYTKVVDREEILASDCNLLFFLYPERKQAADIDLAEMLKEVRKAEVELIAIRREIEEKKSLPEYENLI